MRKNTKNLFWGIVAVALIGVSIQGTNLFQDILTPSTSQPSDSIPVYNIAARPDHPFFAVGEQVILTVTVLPSDASDKTVVWSSSDATKVSITKLTDTTARMKCEAAFTGEVTITATATNGTVTTDDDFSASCVCTYVVPVTSIELTWEGSTAINPDTHVFEIGDTLFFDVDVQPGNATDKTFELIYDDTYLELLEPEWSQIEFEVIANTIIGQETVIEVVSNFDEDITDSVSIQIGEELDTIEFWNNAHIYKSTNGGTSFGEFGSSLAGYADAYYEYENVKFNVGDLIWLDLGELAFKHNAVGITFNETYLYFLQVDTADVYDPLTLNYTYTSASGQIDFPAGETVHGAVFEVLAPISFSSEFTVDITFYSYNDHVEEIPFTLFRPVSGISIDNDTYVY